MSNSDEVEKAIPDNDAYVRRYVIDIGIAKTNKYATRESGDTVEVVERPAGGLSLVLVDGQGSGQAAKALSSMLTAKAVALVKDGVRDGAVARAMHDTLFVYRGGKVSASLDMVSVDVRERVLVVTRNSTTPLTVGTVAGWRSEPPGQGPIGLYRFSRPAVQTLPLELGLTVVVISDGIDGAGRRRQQPSFDVAAFCRTRTDGEDAQSLANAILQEALDRDEGRAADDMSVAVVRITEGEAAPLIRRQSVRVPVE